MKRDLTVSYPRANLGAVPAKEKGTCTSQTASKRKSFPKGDPPRWPFSFGRDEPSLRVSYRVAVKSVKVDLPDDSCVSWGAFMLEEEGPEWGTPGYSRALLK